MLDAHTTAALAVAILAAIANWAYSKFVLSETGSDKVFVKTLASGLLAAAAVSLYLRQQPAPSLHADPFFD